MQKPLMMRSPIDSKRILPENVFLNRPSAHKVLLNDPLQHRRSAGVVPDPFGINDGNGALLANP
jgi:hypothetical protein